MEFLFALFAGAVAHDFKLCAPDHFGLKTVDLIPDPIVAGKVLEVKMSGVPDVDITGGKGVVTVKALGIVIATLNVDVCTDLGIACPSKKGTPITAVVKYDVPADAPGGISVTVNVKVMDPAGAVLTCVDLQVKVVKGLFDHKFLFSHFVRQHNKKYEASELMHRMRVFGHNFRKVFNHSLQGHAWTMDLNQFADLSWDEFKATRLGAVPARSGEKVELKNIPLADAVDWRTKNAVTPVKDQASCGSCWAFSATGAIEGAFALANGTLLSFAEQELVDCANSYGNEGCNGGWMDNAFDYIIDKGICLEPDYKYTARDGACNTKQCTNRVNPIRKYVDVPEGKEAALMAAVNLQPVAIAIEADQGSFQFYSGGVMDGKCGKDLDHGVLAVGYGTDAGKDYWIVKNSWGSNWGEKGYIRLIRDRDQCGLSQAASYPLATQ